jgi:hypothetical protein
MGEPLGPELVAEGKVYRPRRPKESPLWQCLSGHFDAFQAGYEERYQPRYGFLRPIIPEVVIAPLVPGLSTSNVIERVLAVYGGKRPAAQGP